MVSEDETKVEEVASEPVAQTAKNEEVPASSGYYAVFYSKDGTIHLWPGEDQPACLQKLRDMMEEDPRVKAACAATTVIKRDMSHFPDGRIFGKPKSLDVKAQIDKEDAKSAIDQK
jgi:hypothetical protein